MANIRTLRDINSKGYRLGSTREVELEEALRDSCKTNSELIDDFKNYRKVHKKFINNIKRDKVHLQRNLNQTSKDKEELTKYIYQLIDEIKRLNSELDNLSSQIKRLQISNVEYETKNITQLRKIESLQSMFKIMEGKLLSAQKDVISIQNNSSKKESEILSLKSKIAELERSSCQVIENIKSELESKVNELECLKSEAISAELARPKPVVGGDDEKNTQSEEQSFISNSDRFEKPLLRNNNNNLAQYFVHRKSIEESKISDETNVSETNKDNIFQSQEIVELPRVKNVTPFLPADSPSPIESHSQIPVEAIPMVSVLGSPMIALLLLALLIIVTIWITFIRQKKIKNKNNDIYVVYNSRPI